MFLARILTPRDYGINAMAVAVIGLAGVVFSLGLSTATIQRAEINHEQVSTLFWINAGIGFLFTIIIASLSPVVAWFFKTPELLWVMITLSGTFFISGLSVQHSALLSRQMRFYSIAKIQIIAMVAGISVAIITGRQGFGYWALIFNFIINSVVNLIGTWIATGWLPGRIYRDVGVASMIKFGNNIMKFSLINYFSRNLDNILIGRYHGDAALGLYSKAYQLLMMPITNMRDPLTKVAMPVLSRIQNEPLQYRNYYCKCISILAFVSMPLVVFMFVCSDQLINLLLGSQWMGASELFKILAIAALIQPVVGTGGMVLLSLGRGRRYFVLGLINAIITSFSFVCGLPWGAKGVAISYVISNYVLFLPTLFYSFEDTSIRLFDFVVATYKPLLASLVMGIGCFFLIPFLGHISPFISMPICFLVCAGLYLTAFGFFPNGMTSLLNYYSYGRLIFERR
jgi:PST family polysaccharide transporter